MNEPASPASSAARDWMYAAAWTVLTYAVIPYTRPVVSFLGAKLGGDPVLNKLFGGLVFLTLFGFGRNLVCRPGFDAARGIWFAAVLAGYAYFMWTIDIAPEKIHFLQYGVLALLVYRALEHHVESFLKYPQTLAICFIAGLLDEHLQSLVPKRVGEIGDAFLNLAAVVLALIGLAKAWVPETSAPVRRRAEIWGTAGFLLAAGILGGMFTQAHSDFGHRLADPAIGTFNSSFAAGALAAEDAGRGKEVAALLDATDDTSYDTFLRSHPRSADAYVHETRVRFFRRDRYLRKGPAATGDERAEHFKIAILENRVLEKYYPTLMAHSRRVWSDTERRIESELATAPIGAFHSAVGDQLITAFDLRALWAGIAIYCAVILAGVLWASIRVSSA